MTTRYRVIPEEVDALQRTGSPARDLELKQWLWQTPPGWSWRIEQELRVDGLDVTKGRSDFYIITTKGEQNLRIGDYLVLTATKEFFVMPAEAFENRYEEKI